MTVTVPGWPTSIILNMSVMLKPLHHRQPNWPEFRGVWVYVCIFMLTTIKMKRKGEERREGFKVCRAQWNFKTPTPFSCSPQALHCKKPTPPHKFPLLGFNSLLAKLICLLTSVWLWMEQFLFITEGSSLVHYILPCRLDADVREQHVPMLKMSKPQSQINPERRRKKNKSISLVHTMHRNVY